MLGYKFIAETLSRYGVSHLFYVESMLENVILEANKLGIQSVMAHTENAAGYMADGFARASGKPGLCMAQSIGAANLAGGIYDARLANSPVVAITGKKPAYMQYRGAYQEAEHRLLYEGITKFNAEIWEPKQLPNVFHQLFHNSVADKPGPVHADLPNGLGVDTEFWQIGEEHLPEKQTLQLPSHRPSATPDMIVNAMEALNVSEKPFLIAGRGAICSGASDVLNRFASQFDIPIATTPDGKTIIDETDPLWAGVVGAYGNASANKAFNEADLVIFVGTQANDQTTNNWTLPNAMARVIQVDIDATEVGRNYPKAIKLIGDIQKIIEQLIDTGIEKSRKNWRNVVRKYVSDEAAELKSIVYKDCEKISPYRLCHELSNILPDDAVVVADTGNSAIWTSTLLRMKKTQRYYRAAGSLGWSLPASLGVKCALPENPVFCFLGDGAFYYHMSELETAVRYGLNTITIINNNQGLVQVRELLDVVYRHEDPAKKEKAYRFENVNLSKIAQELGCFAARVEKVEDLAQAIDEAMRSNKPAVIEVLTTDDYTPNPMPNGPRPLYGAAAAFIESV